MAIEDPLPAIEAAPKTVSVEEQKAATKAVKEPKVKSAPKPKTPPSHPPYEEMVKDAIVSLKEKSGSSQYAIQKFLEEKHKKLPANFRKFLLFHLKKLVTAGKIVKVKASFKLSPSRVSAPKLAYAEKPKVKAATVKTKAKAKPKTAAVAAAKSKVKAKVAAPKTKSVAKVSSKLAAKPVKAKGPVKAKAVAKPKAAPVKAKTITNAKAAAKPKAVAPKPMLKERPTKAARTSTRTSPGRKAPSARPAPKKAPVKKTAVKAKSPAKRVPAVKKAVAKRGKK